MTGSSLPASTGARPAEAEKRPRLLFLCQTLPYPPDSGVLLRTFNVLRLLAEDYVVTALCFYRRADRGTAAEVERSLAGLRRFGRVEVFPIPQEHSRVRFAHDHLRSLLTQRAYTVFAYESAAFRERLRTLLETERFDLVHVDSLDLSGYLPMLRGLPVVCVHHNVESALLHRRAVTHSGVAAAYLAMQARLTEREERRWCPGVRLNVAVSPADRDDLLHIAPGSRFTVVPNGVDTSVFQPGTGDNAAGGLVFVGGYTWQPNRDAMDYFCTSVLPLLRGRGVDPQVTWVGRAPEAVTHRYATRYRVQLTGYLEDVKPTVQAARCYIVPLRAGGGTRLKILDAWAMGKAVVSTSVGCEGLDARDGENILIRDDAAGFADAVQAVLEDSTLRRRLEQGARRTAEAVYEWRVIGAAMKAEYRTVLEAEGAD